MSERLQKLRGQFPEFGIDSMLITDILNVRYLSGFTGSTAVLLIARDFTFLFSDSRYEEQAAEECPGLTLDISQSKWALRVAQLVYREGIQKVGFESQSISYLEWHELAEQLGRERLFAAGDPVHSLRMIKDRAEIEEIRKAANIVDLAYEHVVDFIKPGMQERQVAIELDYFMRQVGADKEGFDSIAASGPRAALPHGHPTDRVISEGEFLVLDYGARLNGYNSDITRTVMLGTPDAKQNEVYDIVLEAQSRAIKAIRPGIPGGEVDAVARDYIASKGYGDRFGHGLGHGLGLAVHDGRIFSPKSEIVLQPGMVATVEPGIYIPGWGGVRTEDDILVTESGCEVLTHSPKVLSIPIR